MTNTAVHANTVRAALKGFNRYLKNKGVESPHLLKKAERIRLYCLETKQETPQRKDFDYFLAKEYVIIKEQEALLPKVKKVSKRERKAIYIEYINSIKWKEFRQTIIDQRGYACEKCGCNDKVIHAHHLTYIRFMNELPEDIQLLCVPCHEDVHSKKIGRNSTRVSKMKPAKALKNELLKVVTMYQNNHELYTKKLENGVLTEDEYRFQVEGNDTWFLNRIRLNKI